MENLIVKDVSEYPHCNVVNFAYEENPSVWCGAQYIDKQKKLEVGDLVQGQYQSGKNFGDWAFQFQIGRDKK